MMIGKSPFYSKHEEKTFENILEKELKFPSFLSESATSLISQLLDRDLDTRLGVGETAVQDIKDHEFFAGVDWESIMALKETPPFVPETDGNEDLSNFDAEFTNEELKDTYVAPNKLKGGTNFDGFTFVSQPMMLSVEENGGQDGGEAGASSGDKEDLGGLSDEEEEGVDYGDF
eukprot:TRINITY_DN4033_c1_g1_i2.p1 TRINITY_DN4033_c1_g1~~TRINITY_DN4033_c1_g1_i2.p1  ORF type:complete len:174 (+),score=71.11 TRINITY_DN4033_c1_g1_i2:181-702(+)